MRSIMETVTAGVSSDLADMTHFLITAPRAVVNLSPDCFPRREFSCDEPGLKRSASYPLIHSESFQLATTEGEHANQHNNNHVLQAEDNVLY